MDFGGSVFEASRSNATSSTYTGPLSRSPKARPIEIIIITAVVFVVFCVLCCVGRSVDRYYPEANDVTQCNKCSRIEFIKSNLPSRILKNEASDDTDRLDDDIDLEMESAQEGIAAAITGTPPVQSGPQDVKNRQQPPKATRLADNALSASPTNCISSQASCDSSKGTQGICSICLGSYHSQDVVSWSTNSACPHEYHRSCIEPWLIIHEECPLCRCIFLQRLSHEDSITPQPPATTARPSERQDTQHPWRAYWFEQRRGRS